MRLAISEVLMRPIPTSLVATALKITTIVNCTVGITGVAAPTLSAQLLFDIDGPLEGHFLRIYLIVWLFVGVMGLGYWFGAKDPRHQSGIILFGGVGKILFAGMCIECLFSGFGTMLLLLPIVFDGVLGVLFLLYIIQPDFNAETG